MSKNSPSTGQVKSIKNKFENLNNTLDSLDISSATTTTPATTKPTFKTYPTHSYKLQRTSTSFELLRHNNNNYNNNTNNNNNNNENNIVTKGRKHFELQPKGNEIKRQSSDSSLLKSQKTHQFLKPLNEIKENLESKLERHTSDPVKRNSIIKRSPAFRFGDKQNKATLTKLSPVEPIEFKEKFEKFFNQSIQNKEDFEKDGVTDSIKAALKQPLPQGPPPLKPPRSFDTTNTKAKNNNDIVQIFENKNNNHNIIANSNTNNTDNKNTDNINNNNNNNINNNINNINTINNNDIDNKNCNLNLSVETNNDKLLKKNDKKFMKTDSTDKLLNLLNCVQCTNPVYDTLVKYSKLNENYEFINNNNNNNNYSGNVSEHIYMEPYGHLQSHLKNNQNNNNLFNIIDNNNNLNNLNDMDKKKLNLDSDGLSITDDKMSTSNCSCPEEHNVNSVDLLHYMCTKIDDNVKPDNNATDSDSINTYDEINILVNAAFEEGPSGAADSGNFSIDTTMCDPVDVLANNRKSPIKISRSLTDKRKDYVRRISEKPVSTTTYGSIDQSFNSLKLATTDATSPPTLMIEKCETTSERINKYKQLVESTKNNHKKLQNNNNNNIDNNNNNNNTMNNSNNGNNTLITENESQTISSNITTLEKIHSTTNLFQMCLLIGYNVLTNSAYIKLKFPNDEQPPQNIEQLVFADNFSDNLGNRYQDYSLVLTDYVGNRVYGYCRRILPESSEICLPLAYCMISDHRAPGFYFKILKEIESRHGISDFQTNFLLTNLQNYKIPEPGKYLHIKLPLLSPRPKTIFMSNHKITSTNNNKRLSLEVNPKWLTETAVLEAFGGTMANTSNNNNNNNNGTSSTDKHKIIRDDKNIKKNVDELNSTTAAIDLNLINRSLFASQRPIKIDEILIRRPNDLRLESTELSDLFNGLGADLLIIVFGSLLLERKVILFSKNLSLLSSCILGLQTILYPFQWQYTMITLLPKSLMEICQAPVPILAGILDELTIEIEDGIIINLDTKMIVQKCGDEATILPTSLKDSLLISLKLVNLLDQGKMLSSVLIAEAFLRFYVELFAGYKVKQFEKESFIKSHPSQSVRLFLEWFVETAMFRHFVNSKYFGMPKPTAVEETIYALFENRLLEKIQNKTKTNQNIETILKNCKIINKKGKTFRSKFFKS